MGGHDTTTGSSALGVSLGRSVLLVLLTLNICPSAAVSQPNGGTFTPEAEGVSLQESWRFHAGDDPAWSDPDYDVSHWRRLQSTTLDSLPVGSFSGIGWFRCDLAVDSARFGSIVNLNMALYGAVEIFLEGHPVLSLGQVGQAAEEEELHVRSFHMFHPVVLGTDSVQTLAVRYSNHRWFPGCPIELPGGFEVRLLDVDGSGEEPRREAFNAVRHQMFFAGLSLAFFMVHLMLFVFIPKIRANLLLAIFTAFTAMLSYLPIQAMQTNDFTRFVVVVGLFKIAVIGTALTGLWALYSMFYNRLPRLFRILMVPAIVIGLASPWLGRSIVYGMTIVLLIDIVRVIAVAIHKRRPGASVLLAGMVIFGITSTYQMLLDLGAVGNIIENYYNYHLWGVFAMLASMSIGLAWRFSRINVDLSRKLDKIEELTARAIGQERRARQQDIAQRLLEKEIAHKRTELDEARKLEQALEDLEQANRHLRDTQSQLVQNEKMASLGMLVAGVAHEINTPVGAIGSMHNTLVRAVDKLRQSIHECSSHADQATMDRFLKVIDDANSVIESGTERVNNIVHRLRSFARLDEAELVRADINEGLEDTLVLAHHELKYDIELDRQFGDIPGIACYAGQLNQVFLNLLVNARQAIKGKGRITIRTAYEDNHVVIEISDNGQGIPPDNLARIFDPGFTTKGAGVGTGLGLSICYQIIQSHHGEIRATSTVGEGTSFTIRIPDNLDTVIGDPKEQGEGEK